MMRWQIPPSLNFPYYWRELSNSRKAFPSSITISSRYYWRVRKFRRRKQHFDTRLVAHHEAMSLLREFHVIERWHRPSWERFQTSSFILLVKDKLKVNIELGWKKILHSDSTVSYETSGDWMNFNKSPLILPIIFFSRNYLSLICGLDRTYNLFNATGRPLGRQTTWPRGDVWCESLCLGSGSGWWYEVILCCEGSGVGKERCDFRGWGCLL